ncbi:unnamed protein product [Calypogeia fissa]
MFDHPSKQSSHRFLLPKGLMQCFLSLEVEEEEKGNIEDMDYNSSSFLQLPVDSVNKAEHVEMMVMGDTSHDSSEAATSMNDWAELIPEALTEIFRRLPFEDRLRVVPQVCKSWNEASYNPACWTVVDMEPWFIKKTEEDYWWEFDCESKVDHLVKLVVDRSCGQLRELRTMHVSDMAIDYIAERCPLITGLSIPNSLMVTNKSALNLATSSPRLQRLDVSDCYNISMPALEAFGRNCPSLVWLGRNMLKNNETISGQSSPGGDEEAVVMSKHMGRLKHLEMKKTSLSDFGLRHLATGCRELENLNLACCTALSPRALDDVKRNCSNLKTFTKPITPRLHVAPDFHVVLFE